MIKSVRKILNGIMLERTMTEEMLLTSSAEAERVMKDCPLVPVYDDPDQLKVLRPNDLLISRYNIDLINDAIS